MSEPRTYRHRVTGLIGEYSDITARGMGDVLEEVSPDAKPKVRLSEIVKDATDKPRVDTSTQKEKKDV